MANFLITGGCGFIGSRLAHSLVAQGHTVRVLDNLVGGDRYAVPGQCDLVVGDVCSPQIVRECMSGMDGCFHLAAARMTDQSETARRHNREANVGSLMNVLNACKANGALCRPSVVYASSAAVYGDNAGQPLKESAEVRPLTPYGADKAACELEARIATVQHGIATVGLRLFNVYGMGQEPDSPYAADLWHMLDALWRGDPVILSGDGQEGCDWIAVDDVIPFLIAAMNLESSSPEVINVCSGKVTPSVNLARLLASLLGRPLMIRHAPRHGELLYTLAGDPGKARSLLHCEAVTDIGTGMKDLVEKWLTQRNAGPSMDVATGQRLSHAG